MALCAQWRRRVARNYGDVLANLPQLLLLCVLVLLIGGMIGLERTVLPIMGGLKFQLTHTALLSFISAFGVSKGCASLVVGELADRKGRKFTLILGWIIGLPVFILILLAEDWSTIVLANVFLGFNQGLCWAATIYMMLDSVDKRHDGFVLGVNDFCGYFAVAMVAFSSGYHVHLHNDFSVPFSFGVGFAVLGLLLSFFTKETLHLAKLKASRQDVEHRHLLSNTAVPRAQRANASLLSNLWNSFVVCSFSNSHVFACCQAGFLQAFKDGIVWGLFPLFLLSFDVSIRSIAFLVAVYPLTWSIVQLYSGYLSDNYGTRWPISSGLWLESLALLYMVWTPRFILSDLTASQAFIIFATGSVMLGIGTALLYPTLHVGVAHGVPQDYFASAIGIYKVWREAGYSIGALLAGAVADAFGIRWSLTMGAFMTVFAGLLTSMYVADFEDLHNEPASELVHHRKRPDEPEIEEEGDEAPSVHFV